MKKKYTILHGICIVLLWWAGYCVCDEMAIVSLNSLGQPMMYGVRNTVGPIADNGATAFIAPIEERADSTSNGFHASYLRIGGELRELFPGYEKDLAQPPLNIFSKTTNIRLVANHDFSLFAIIVEDIETSWPTVNGIRIPKTLGTQLVVVDTFGNLLQKEKLTFAAGNASASQCHVSFSDDGKLLAACGQYIGLCLYDSPTTDLTSFTKLDVGYKTGRAVITGDGTKVFFTRNDEAKRDVCYMDLMTREIVETGLTTNGIDDVQLAASHDGSCVAFRGDADNIVVAVREEGIWKKTYIKGKEVRGPAISSDGRYVVYQTRGASCSQIMEYDCKNGVKTLISINDDGEEADADCTSPSISADGSWITFVSAASNLVSNSNGQPQLYIVNRERMSVTLKLKKGWNLCGTPLTLDEQSVELLKSEPACWGWSNDKFCLLENFQAGQGFWLYALEDKTLRLTGMEAEPMPLQHGWNLVMLSLYPSAEAARCFGFDGKSYVRLSEEANRAQAAWVFY